MKQQIDDQTHIISKLISYAGSTLKQTLPVIKNKFRDFPICLLDYTENEKKENLIEIRFDSEQATLSCMLNEDSTCNNSFLFFDQTEHLNECINYLRTVYEYDYISCRWELPVSYLSLEKAGRDICLFFYPKG